MEYFQNHTFKETCERFNLTESEMKSLQTAAYRMPELAHLRKDTRRKDAWTIKELKFMLKRAGIIERKNIGKHLGRGFSTVIKEKCQLLNCRGVRYINGLPLRLASLIVPDIQGIKTLAGAPGPNGCCHVTIVLWTELEKKIKYKRINPEIRAAIKAMARFQKWIFGKESIKPAVKRFLRGRDEKRVNNEK